MTNSLDFEHLRTLIAISECGGFGKAAAARHISQPALSQHVRLLERGLKRKLFEKDGRQMRLTVAGEQVLAEARRIVGVHDAALRRLDAESRPVITVGSTEHAAEQVLPEMLQVLSEAFPEMRPRFEIGRSTQLAEAVDRGVVDLAFVLDPNGRGAGHEIARLALRWYAAPGWQSATEEDVLGLVAFEEPCDLRARALTVLGSAARDVEVVAQSTTLEGVLAGVRAGLGVALLPSAGGRPTGLVERRDLPDAGDAVLRLVVRRGIASDVEQAALDAGTAFLAARPPLTLVREASSGGGR